MASDNPVSILQLFPGHFHAALVLKQSLPGLSPAVKVFAPLDADTLMHLQRIHAFNSRAVTPTAWTLECHLGAQCLERFREERPGQIVVLSGRNRQKLHWMETAIEQGMHVLADKPWIIEPEQFPYLQAVVERARRHGLLIYDIMTERYEITTILQSRLVQTPEIVGHILPGSIAEPSVFFRSVHYLSKSVSGVPLRRPTWFFDIHEEGEALADVGTHLVDLALWMLFRGELPAKEDIVVLRAERWPTSLHRDAFSAITGVHDFPAELSSHVHGDTFLYPGNNLLHARLGKTHACFEVSWAYSNPFGGDTHQARFEGSEAIVEVRQDPHSIPELWVVPRPGNHSRLEKGLYEIISSWQEDYPGVRLHSRHAEFWIEIPAEYRIGHEEHFAEVFRQFLSYLERRETYPTWEDELLLRKYSLTTEGIKLARASNPSTHANAI